MLDLLSGQQAAALAQVTAAWGSQGAGSALGGCGELKPGSRSWETPAGCGDIGLHRVPVGGTGCLGMDQQMMGNLSEAVRMRLVLGDLVGQLGASRLWHDR